LIGSHSAVIRWSQPFSNYIIFSLCVSNLWMQLLTWCKLVDTRWQLGIHCHLLCYVLSIHHISICLHFWISVQEERLPELGPHGKHPAWDIPLQFVRQIQAGNWLKMFSFQTSITRDPTHKTVLAPSLVIIDPMPHLTEASGVWWRALIGGDPTEWWPLPLLRAHSSSSTYTDTIDLFDTSCEKLCNALVIYAKLHPTKACFRLSLRTCTSWI
jgi:hypothetical protein